MDRDKIVKMVVILACVVVIAGSLSRLMSRDSMTLTQYAELNPDSRPSDDSGSKTPSSGPDNSASQPLESSGSNSLPSSESSGSNDSPSSEASGSNGSPSSESSGSNSPQPSGAETAPSSEGSGLRPSGEITDPSDPEQITTLTGAALNGTSLLEQRVSLTDDFYYEPVSDKLKRYMTGISYPEEDPTQNDADPAITFQELRYVHILHYDFEGNSREGELICNAYIAQDLTEIFLELYRNEYQLERVLLIDEYDGDDNLSMEDNNTSCFNYRPVTNNASLSMHAYGLAVDINPLYNPYISYSKDGTQEILPASAEAYADRSVHFPYKIDENDLCYKLFYQHGFTWGGNWNNVKDYQHFQKAMP